MKKSKKERRIRFICFLAAVAVLSTFLYVSSNKTLQSIALKSFDSLISSASYHAIDCLLEEGYDYKSLMDVTTDINGNVTMVTTNSYKVTSMASSVAKNTYSYLLKETNSGVDVPLFAFTGINLISGYGKKIKMKLISISSVKCEIISNFSDAGINQTRHTITVNIESNVTFVTKSSSQVAKDIISILVFDNLIVGKVPDVYLNSQVIGGADKN